MMKINLFSRFFESLHLQCFLQKVHLDLFPGIPNLNINGCVTKCFGISCKYKYLFAILVVVPEKCFLFKKNKITFYVLNVTLYY